MDPTMDTPNPGHLAAVMTADSSSAPVSPARATPVPGGKPAKERTSICSYCNMSFNKKEHLQRHERTHTLARPYVCEHPGCGKTFARRDTLTRHTRLHSRDDDVLGPVADVSAGGTLGQADLSTEALNTLNGAGQTGLAAGPGADVSATATAKPFKKRKPRKKRAVSPSDSDEPSLSHTVSSGGSGPASLGSEHKIEPFIPLPLTMQPLLAETDLTLASYSSEDLDVEKEESPPSEQPTPGMAASATLLYDLVRGHTSATSISHPIPGMSLSYAAAASPESNSAMGLDLDLGIPSEAGTNVASPFSTQPTLPNNDLAVDAKESFRLGEAEGLDKAQFFPDSADVNAVIAPFVSHVTEHIRFATDPADLVGNATFTTQPIPAQQSAFGPQAINSQHYRSRSGPASFPIQQSSPASILSHSLAAVASGASAFGNGQPGQSFLAGPAGSPYPAELFKYDNNLSSLRSASPFGAAPFHAYAGMPAFAPLASLTSSSLHSGFSPSMDDFHRPISSNSDSSSSIISKGLAPSPLSATAMLPALSMRSMMAMTASALTSSYGGGGGYETLCVAAPSYESYNVHAYPSALALADIRVPAPRVMEFARQEQKRTLDDQADQYLQWPASREESPPSATFSGSGLSPDCASQSSASPSTTSFFDLRDLDVMQPSFFADKAFAVTRPSSPIASLEEWLIKNASDPMFD